jgi:hypothetical protein
MPPTATATTPTAAAIVAARCFGQRVPKRFAIGALRPAQSKVETPNYRIKRAEGS